tara:strand:- start:428 stop:634 length:207 start_codon:yes stop_codon:yes gene_type:complete
MDDFKRNIKGFNGRRVNSTGTVPGRTCPCCRETDKKHSRKLARRRLKQQDGVRGWTVALWSEEEAGEE